MSRKILDRRRDQDLPACRLVRDPRREGDVEPEEIASLPGHLTGVEADPHAHGRVLGKLSLCQGPLDLDRARERGRHRLEGHHEAVALGLHDLAALSPDLAANDRVVLLEETEPGLVAQPLVERGRALDIGEHEGDGSVGGGHALQSGTIGLRQVGEPAQRPGHHGREASPAELRPDAHRQPYTFDRRSQAQDAGRLDG